MCVIHIQSIVKRIIALVLYCPCLAQWGGPSSGQRDAFVSTIQEHASRTCPLCLQLLPPLRQNVSIVIVLAYLRNQVKTKDLMKGLTLTISKWPLVWILSTIRRKEFDLIWNWCITVIKDFAWTRSIFNGINPPPPPQRHTHSPLQAYKIYTPQKSPRNFKHVLHFYFANTFCNS